MNSQAPAPELVLFDLDHTLLPLDSDYAWGEFTTRIGWTDAGAFQRQNEAFYAQYEAGGLDIAEYVRFATVAFRARSPEEALAARDRFMREVIEPAIRPAALELVEAHRAAGATLVIVTATNEWVTQPIARRFGIDELIAVDLERDASGRYTGEILGTPSFGAGKVDRVQDWLAARGLGWGDQRTVFYSDSHNDLPLLERVDVPVATNPDPQLRELAQARGWRVLELFRN